MVEVVYIMSMFLVTTTIMDFSHQLRVQREHKNNEFALSWEGVSKVSEQAQK